MSAAVVSARTGTLPVAAAGTLLSMLAFTAPMATVPAIARGLGAGIAAQSWFLSSMSLGLAAALLVTGAIGDDFGRRRMFTAGAAALTAGSLLCALAPDSVTFILGRIAQGLGAAAVVSCSLAVISHAYPAGPRRAHATGVWGASLGAGIAAGPVLVSAFEQLSHWRIGYLLITVAAAALTRSSRRYLDESTSGQERAIDIAGSALLGAGLACLLAGLTQGRQGWTRPTDLVLLGAAVLLLGGFLAHQRMVRAALLDLSLFARPALRAATTAAAVTGAGIIALMSFLCTMLQRGLDHSPLAAALLMLTWSVPSVGTALLTRRLPERIPGYVRLAASLLVIGVGMAALGGLSTGSTLWRLVPGLLIAGVGSGTLNATLGRESVASVPARRAGMGSGINNTARYVGSALGVTIVTVIAVRPSPHPRQSLLSGWNTASLVCAVISAAGALAILLDYRSASKRSVSVMPGP